MNVAVGMIKIILFIMQVTCQAENQAVQNKQKVVSKAPSGCKLTNYSFSKLD